MVELREDTGFSYPIVLGTLLSIGILSQIVYSSAIMGARRLNERVIESEGRSFISAIESYWLAGGDNPELPRSIDNLLEDRREGSQRHLRRELRSPFEDDDWSYLIGDKGGISGAVLNSNRRTVRKVIEDADGTRIPISTYSDWKFEFNPAAFSELTEEIVE